MTKLLDHSYIFITIAFTVYSQLVMRWQVSQTAPPSSDFSSKVLFLFSLLTNPWVISGVLATFLSGLSWLMAMSRFQLSYAFPFMSLNFVAMLLLSALLLNETLTITKLLGVALIVAGTFVVSRG